MLPLSFAASFPPERHYLSTLMKYIKTHRTAVTVDEISDATGIPQGKSTGKVVPHLKYLLGMNLIQPDGNDWYHLTPFGKVVYEYDRSFSEPITAWACHAFLCDKMNGSPLYREACILLSSGASVSREVLVERISENLISKLDDSVVSPMIGFYFNDNAFSGAHIIIKDGVGLNLNSVPLRKVFIPLFGAFVCYYLEAYFSTKEQVSSTEFLEETSFSRIFGITEQDFISLLDPLSGEGYIKVSNLVNPPVMTRTKATSECWEDLYMYIV